MTTQTSTPPPRPITQTATLDVDVRIVTLSQQCTTLRRHIIGATHALDELAKELDAIRGISQRLDEPPEGGAGRV